MSIITRKKIQSNIRLLSLFERELKSFHQIFKGDFYYLNFILQHKAISSNIDIKVEMVLIRTPIWKSFRTEPDNMKILLARFARYFSISEVSITRHFQCFYTPSKKRPQDLNFPQNIEDRVFVEIFTNPGEWHQI